MASYEKVGKRWKAVIRRVGSPKVTKTFDTKREAQFWARDYEQKLDNQASDFTLSSLTLSILIRKYIAEETPLKKSAAQEKLRLERFLRDFPQFSAKPVNKIVPRDVALWRDARLKLVSPDTVRREWNNLSAIFTCALKKWGLPITNPFRLVERPKGNAARSQRISEAVINEIIAAFDYRQGCKAESGKQKVAWCFLFAIETAMRAGEILKLKPEDIQGRIALLYDTKNGDDRKVPLSKTAIDLLAQITLPVGISSEYLDVMYRRFRPKSLSHIRFHDTRHEALSRMAKKIPNPMDLAKISGHRDIKTLLNVYYAPDDAHLISLLD